MPRRWRPVLAAVALTALLAGCGAGGGSAGEPTPAPPSSSSPLADCSDLLAGPRPTPEDPLPALTLPCFTGGEPVALDQLRGPAVVNLWASWCSPCRDELPVMQRLAERADGRLQVVGVVVSDRPAAAAALAEDLGLTFPALEDRDDRLRPRLGAAGVPATAFVDAAGNLRYVHTMPLSETDLARLVEEHLGVTVG